MISTYTQFGLTGSASGCGWLLTRKWRSTVRYVRQNSIWTLQRSKLARSGWIMRINWLALEDVYIKEMVLLFQLNVNQSLYKRPVVKVTVLKVKFNDVDLLISTSSQVTERVPSHNPKYPWSSFITTLSEVGFTLTISQVSISRLIYSARRQRPSGWMLARVAIGSRWWIVPEWHEFVCLLCPARQ